MPTTAPPHHVAVLDDAVSYAAACLQPARSCSLDLPTPCTGWRLGSLLLHMGDSLDALAQAARFGRVDLDAHPLAVAGDFVDVLELRACALSAAWHERLTSAPIGVGDLSLGRGTLALVGALEIAVHGWDVARTTGRGPAFPEALAVRLLEVALTLVTPADRGPRFAPAVAVEATASAGDRLLAHLGRAPYTCV